MFMKRESMELVGTRFANTTPDLHDTLLDSEADVLVSVPLHELDSADLCSHMLLPGDITVRVSTSGVATLTDDDASSSISDSSSCSPGRIGAKAC